MAMEEVKQSLKGPVNVSTSLVFKTLVADKVFKYFDVDVRVVVVSCLSEIIRITIPDTPYNDEEMKVRASLLLIFCNEVQLENRDYHPEGPLLHDVYHNPCLGRKRGDLQLLYPILACLRQYKGALPIAQKLADNVPRKCASKVKPYLVKTVETLGVSLGDYSHVVVSICRDTCGDGEHDHVCSDTCETNHIDEEIPVETTPADTNMLDEKSPKSEINNDVTPAGKDEIMVDSDSTKSMEDNDKTNVSKDADGLSNVESNGLGAEHTGPDKISVADGDKPTETQSRKRKIMKMVTSPKSSAEVGEDEHDSKAKLRSSSKRKWTVSKEKTATYSGKDKVLYDDSDKEHLYMRKEKWKFVEDATTDEVVYLFDSISTIHRANVEAREEGGEEWQGVIQETKYKR
ncbi:PREDICTED: uncharacterized protein LOC104799680 [Tarenaya hassleriana]|uniref:uncharacterized protein LOC104799680 n=1 Tax=Tarenaya hassleriana TaxID=28532 RepID=UPI0008FD5EA3|nr:PREDICTED: uncharacterized protein LOC104799680 [Tarenaya hassleriana]